MRASPRPYRVSVRLGSSAGGLSLCLSAFLLFPSSSSQRVVQTSVVPFAVWLVESMSAQAAAPSSQAPQNQYDSLGLGGGKEAGMSSGTSLTCSFISLEPKLARIILVKNLTHR